jgi:hypothetical protein
MKMPKPITKGRTSRLSVSLLESQTAPSSLPNAAGLVYAMGENTH